MPSKKKAPSANARQNGKQVKKNNKKKKSKAGSSLGVSTFPQKSVAVAYSTNKKTSAPIIRRNQDGSVRVTHREFIKNIVGSDEYLLSTVLPVNPGIGDVFPWLSTFANSFEMYEFNSLVFKYYTRTGSNTSGSVIMSPDYDASDLAPTNEADQCQFKDTTEDAPWKDQSCRLTKSAMHPLGKRKFTRFGAIPSGSDVKLYDVCNFFVASSDGNVGEKWGKLWVEYDIELAIPQKPGNLPVQLQYAACKYLSTDGSGTPANPLGAGEFTYAVPIGFEPEEPFTWLDASGSDPSRLQFNVAEDWLLILALGVEGYTGMPAAQSVGGGTYAPIGEYVMAGAGTASSILVYALYRSVVGSTIGWGPVGAATVADAALRCGMYDYALGRKSEPKKLESEDRILVPSKNIEGKRKIQILEPYVRATPVKQKTEVRVTRPTPDVNSERGRGNERVYTTVPGTNCPSHYWCPPP